MTSMSKKMAAAMVAVTLVMSLSACSNWSKRDRNTALGAGAGAIGGAVLTDGSALGTLGGAAVGGIIGHQVNKLIQNDYQGPDNVRGPFHWSFGNLTRRTP